MIKLDNGQWCYSPALPQAYDGTGGYPIYRKDLPSWNMLYLTFPEEYEARWTVRKFETRVAPENVGPIIAAVDPSLSRMNLDTSLRDLATQPLPLFIHQLPNLDLRIDPAIKLFDGKWIERVLANAKKIYEAHCEKTDEISVIDPSVTNVIMGKFGK